MGKLMSSCSHWRVDGFEGLNWCIEHIKACKSRISCAGTGNPTAIWERAYDVGGVIFSISADAK